MKRVSTSFYRFADNNPLDLIGALVYLGYFGIPHHSFHRIIFHAAVSAQDLNGVSGHAHGHVRAKQFTHG
jgi:hypothetical protein